MFPPIKLVDYWLLVIIGKTNDKKIILFGFYVKLPICQLSSLSQDGSLSIIIYHLILKEGGYLAQRNGTKTGRAEAQNVLPVSTLGIVN